MFTKTSAHAVWRRKNAPANILGLGNFKLNGDYDYHTEAFYYYSYLCSKQVKLLMDKGCFSLSLSLWSFRFWSYLQRAQCWKSTHIRQVCSGTVYTTAEVRGGRERESTARCAAVPPPPKKKKRKRKNECYPEITLALSISSYSRQALCSILHIGFGSNAT